jgi:arylsulfatase A
MSGKRLNRRKFLAESASALGLGFAAGAVLESGCVPVPPSPAWDRPPNIVILFADDMGFSDWNLGGDPTIRTPNLDRMADQGVRLTQFYSGNTVCSPSRAALLTGRNGMRTGLIHVLFPPHTRGLPVEEITLADALKPLGYSTACIGKWHLGHTREYLPLRQGFDYYYGLLYSNDMEPTDLWRNDEMIQRPADQTNITRDYTREALAFIEAEKDNPFLLYLPYTMPHTPLFASEKFSGASRRGLYGDVIEELDWSVGRINDTLDRLGLSENTLVIFTSDNGPAMLMNQHGGSVGLLRGAKGDTWEGGMRVPFIARWPGRLPAGVVSQAVGSVLDFLPTCVNLAGAQYPQDRPLDGIDLMPTLQGRENPERTIYYYWHNHQCAVRHGKWKLHFRYYDHSSGKYMVEENWVAPEKPLLFNIEVDPGERFNLAAEQPQVVSRLAALADDYRAEIERRGENQDLIDWYINVWPTLPRTSTSLELVR